MNLHEKYVFNCKSLAESEEINGLSAVMVGGSVGRGDYDSLSDIDFFLLVEDGYLAEFLDIGMRRMASLLGELLLFHGPVRTGKFAHSFSTFFADRMMCSFHVNSTSTLDLGVMSKAPHLMLYDKDGRYGRALDESKAETPWLRSLLDSTYNLFWLRSLGVCKDIERDYIWLALFHMSDLRSQMMILMRLIEDAPPNGMNYQRSAKCIEKDISDDSLDVLDRTLCVHSRESVSSALLFCMDWYSRHYSSFVKSMKWEDFSWVDPSDEIQYFVKDRLETLGASRY